jgi:pimeloyl-ACP methyl ester carboxylesterase
MRYLEYAFEDDQYRVNVDITIPEYESIVGIVLLHGGIVNRKSLSRKRNSLATHFGQKLNAYTITPDFFGESKVKSKNHATIENWINIAERVVHHLEDKYDVEKIICFGHSLGSIILADVVNNVDSIDAIATYGGPTNLDCNGFRMRQIFRLIERLMPDFLDHVGLSTISMFFDNETRKYFYNQILGNPEYNFRFNKNDYDLDFIRDVIDLTSDYINRIIDSCKPALFMFGSGDRTTYFSKRHLPDFYKMHNISVRHILNGHHITPCRKEACELSKLNPFIEYVKTFV